MMFFTPRRFGLALKRRRLASQRQFHGCANGGAESLRQFVLQTFRRIPEHHLDMNHAAALFDATQRTERLPCFTEIRVREPIQRFDGRHDEINPDLSEGAL